MLFPAYRFFAEEVPMMVVVFPTNGIRQALRSEVDGRPAQRATLSEVRALLDNC
jgi:hypothetical protein